MRFVLFVILLLTSVPVWAHAYLVKSAPAKRAVLHLPPAKIQLWFNESLEPRYSSIALIDAEGKAIKVGAAEVSSTDPRQLSAVLKPLPAGRYVVKYRVLSIDGHIVQDQIPFTVTK